MYKSVNSDIKKYNLSTSLYELHKKGLSDIEFGMDNNNELLEGTFGLYSTANIKPAIGPIKSEYYRIALVRYGTARFSIGLETFVPERNYLIFGFPGQLFSLQNPSTDFFTYYMLFAESFISDKIQSLDKAAFPFLTYTGSHHIVLSEEEAMEIEMIFKKINDEIKAKKPYVSKVIRQYIYLIYTLSLRSYPVESKDQNGSHPQFAKFLKLVSEHFITKRKASDYADLLYISPDHLNRIVKSQSDKTTSEWINTMVIQEAKALLKHTHFTINEIAYKLNFTDPSYFIKVFKKIENSTPAQYRSE